MNVTFKLLNSKLEFTTTLSGSIPDIKDTVRIKNSEYLVMKKEYVVSDNLDSIENIIIFVENAPRF